MAIYRKTYRPYDGGLTPAWSRFLVLPRYALEDLQRSRFLTFFFLATLIYPLVAALIVYVQHNASVLALMNAQGVARMIAINSTFFLSLLGFQGMLAVFLAAFAGPGQVSPDLADNALALYLARPFSRLEYVAGKLSVLLLLLSLMTWIPGLLIFALQGYLEGWAWTVANQRIAVGLFFGSWLWIVLLALLALALSAWVKWKPVAGALMFGVFFVAAGFGEMINHVEDTRWGYLLDVSNLVGTVWVWLFEGPGSTSPGAPFFRVAHGSEIPAAWCCAVLAALCVACLCLLARKLRGVEVAR